MLTLLKVSVWYKRDEAQKRFSFFFISNTLAGAFGGLLAAAIGNLDGHRGWLGWRWIFIIEGSISASLSLFVYLVLPDFPENVNWLSPEEKILLSTRFEEDRGQEPEEKFSWRLLWEVVGNYKGLAAGFLYFGLNMPGKAIFVFSVYQLLNVLLDTACLSSHQQFSMLGVCHLLIRS